MVPRKVDNCRFFLRDRKPVRAEQVSEGGVEVEARYRTREGLEGFPLWTNEVGQSCSQGHDGAGREVSRALGSEVAPSDNFAVRSGCHGRQRGGERGEVVA